MSGSGKLNQREIGREGGEGGEGGTEGNFYRNVNWMQIFDIKILSHFSMQSKLPSEDWKQYLIGIIEIQFLLKLKFFIQKN